MRYLIILFVSIISINTFAQTGIGTTTPDPSAKLDVTSSNKGFLPPRVTLTSATDNTTIPSPAEGLFVYNKGSVGLQAGYYYWNGANWATIATATSAGNGVTSADMVKIYDGVGNTATINSTGATFSVTTSGKYLFDFSTSATCGNCTVTLNFQVRDGSNSNAVIASDMQTSYSNNVHAEYNGKVEANLVVGRSYNVLVTASAGGIYNNDYTRVYMKQVAGNLPVTGQTVDYGIARYTGADGASLSNGSIVNFDANAAGNLTWSNNKFTLMANKTYIIESSLAIYASTPSAGKFQIFDFTNNKSLGNSLFMSQGGSGINYPNANTPLKCIVTPSTNIDVGITLSGYYGAAPGIIGSTSTASTYAISNTSYFIVQQIGSSAIVNPWVLSGNDVYNTTGKVGIGNNAPTKILDVTGDAKISGVLTSGGNAYPTTTGTNLQALTTNGTGTLSWNPVPPVGVVTAFAGSAAPSGYLLCDGTAVSRTTYASLYAIIGTTYGSGDGSTTFNLPDLRSKTIVGVGQGTGLTNRTLASTSGSETKTLTTTELPSHNHGVTDPGHFHFVSGGTTDDRNFTGSGNTSQMYGVFADSGGYNDADNYYGRNTNTKTTGISINNTGGGAAFNIMNPFLALNYIIKF
jgi:microcystin-dependent protein